MFELFRGKDRAIQSVSEKAYQAIRRQKSKVEGAFKTNISNDPSVRWATDGFVAGYTMGLCRRFLEVENLKPSAAIYDSLERIIQNKLDSLLPGLNIKLHTRVKSKVPMCGMVCAVKELCPPSESEVLEKVWSMLLAQELSLGISMRMYAHGRIATDLDEFEMIGEVGEPMQVRYQDGPPPEHSRGY